MAMGLASLASYAPGRIVAGIGASSPIVVERWHRRTFESPLATTESFVTDVRAALAGEAIADGFKLALAPQQVPIWIAAINPRMLQLAGRLADGVFLTWCPPDEIEEKVAVVRESATAAGRDPDGIEVVVSFWGYAGSDPEAALVRLRRAVLAYAMVPTHRAAFARAFPRLEQASEAWDSGDRRGALEHVDDATVEALCAIGPGAIEARIDEYTTAGVDLPVVLLTGARVGDAEGPRATLQTLAGLVQR